MTPINPKGTTVEAYRDFIRTNRVNDEILQDFDQTGYWSLWSEDSHSELEEAIGKANFKRLEENLRSLKLSPQEICYTNNQNQLILKTSYHECPSLKGNNSRNSIAYSANLTIPYTIIKGCLKLAMANTTKATHLEEVGSVILINGGITPQKGITPPRLKTLVAPKLKKINGDLRTWTNTQFVMPKLKEVTGNIILEGYPKSNNSLENLVRVGKSIFCRKATKIYLPNLKYVGESISGFELKEIHTPKLKDVKELRINPNSLKISTLENLITQLSDLSLSKMKKLSKENQRISIANPGGSLLHKALSREVIRRHLSKGEKPLSI
jgi:hypothetical protein